MGDEQRNKDIVRTVEQLWIDEKLDQLDQYFAPNDHSHDRPPFLPQGLAGAKIAHQGSMKSFKDRKLEMKDLFAEGDKVFVRSSGGSSVSPALIPACTSCSATSSPRLRVNCSVITELPLELVEVIWFRPGI